MDAPGLTTEPANRQGVQHLVGQHYAFQRRIGQAVQPGHPILQRRHPRLEGGRLPGPQIGADFQNEILPRQGIQPGQFGEPVRRHLAGARAVFQHGVAMAAFENSGHLPGQGAGEQVAHQRRGGEVAAGAEALLAGAVITEPRGVEGQRHVVGKIQAAPGHGNGRVDALAKGLAVGRAGGIRLRRRWGRLTSQPQDSRGVTRSTDTG